ncbi:MAG: T9SS type A sorting domain-containing protein [Bacteroidales bacterium]|nr:T9SS type A sorting domain-containing protein [Bacteroidales bacterium]
MKTRTRLFAMLMMIAISLSSVFGQEKQTDFPPHGPDRTGPAEGVETDLPKLVRSSIIPDELIKKDFDTGKSGQWIDSKGKEFWICFQKNYDNVSYPLIFRLYITSQVAADVVIEVPGLGYLETVSVAPNEITTFDLPNVQQLVVNFSEQVENKGIYIHSSEDITVYGINRMQYTTDAFLALPLDILNTNYIAVSYPTIENTNNLSQFAVVSPYDGNEIHIIPGAPTVTGNPAGSPVTVILNRGEVYQVQCYAGYDLTGSVIQSGLPVAVFSGHSCANVPLNYGYCDHIVEQLPPTNTWGTTFITYPLEGRVNGDIWRIVSSQDNTAVTLNGESLAILNFGDFYEFILAVPSVIEASNPIMVMQYSTGNTYDPEIESNGDPFMMLIPPMEQFMSSYTFSTPANDFMLNYVIITIPGNGTGSILLDGEPVDASVFEEIPGTGYSAAALPVADGSHHIETTDATKFGIYSYGFWNDDSYGYPGGFSLAYINEGGAPRIALTASTTQLMRENQVSNQPLTIEAAITDDTEPFLAGAWLYYRTVGQTGFSHLEMSNTTGSVWAAVIPGEGVQDPGLEFYIYATDGQLTSFLPAVDHTKNPFTISVLPNQLPVITHQAPQSTFLVTDDIVLKASVFDETNTVDRVWLSFRMKGGNPVYQQLPMNLQGDEYVVTIPAGTFREGIVEYYISATDDFGVRADYGSSVEPLEIKVFEELPSLDLFGHVSDLVLSANGSLVTKAIGDASIDLYAGEEILYTLESVAGVSYTFTDLPYRDDYRLVVRTTIDMPEGFDDMEITLEAPEPVFGEAFEIVVPVSLLREKYLLVDELEHLKIKSDLLFGLVPPIPLAKSYKQDHSMALLGQWLEDYSDNFEQINEGIGRLLIVDQLLSGFFGDASQMSHSTFVALLECIDGFFKTQKVLNHIHKAIIQLDLSPVTLSVVNGLYNKIYGLVFQIFIETPLMALKSVVPDPYNSMIGDAVEAMIAYAQTTSNRDGIEDALGELGKNEFKNAITTIGDEALLSLHYVNVTQDYLDNAVMTARSFDFTGTIDLAFQRTVSMDPADQVVSALEFSRDATDLAQSRSDKLQIAGNVSDKVSQIAGYASVIPGLQILKTVSLVLRGVSMASYGSAAAFTFVRYTHIVREGDMAILQGMHPEQFLKKSSMLQADDQDSYYEKFTSMRLASYESQLDAAVDSYLTLLEEISALIRQDDRQGVMDRVWQLLEEDELLNGHLTVAQAPVHAAAEVSFREDEFFETLFTGMNEMVNKSQSDRIVLYADLMEYLFASPDFQQESFTSSVDSVRNSVEGSSELIEAAGEWVSDVQVPPMVIVSHSEIDRDVVGKDEVFLVKASVRNTGFEAVENVRIVLKVDSSATVISGDTVLIEALGIDEMKEVTWSVRQDAVLETASFYTVRPVCENVKCLSGGGTYLTGDVSFYTSVRDNRTTGDLKLTLFPNPSSAFVNVRIPVSEQGQLCRVTVYNVLGDEVLSEDGVTGDLYRLELRNLPSGFYLVELVGRNKHHGTLLLK